MKKAGFLFNEEDKKNLAMVEKIVSERFSLDNDSLAYFKEQIKDPDISELFFDAFEKAGSSRIVIDIPEEIESSMDYSWKTFRGRFYSFIKETGFNFNDYKQNKIEINKNIFKPKKALINFYTKIVLEFADRVAEEVLQYDTTYPTEFIEKEIDCSLDGDFSFLLHGFSNFKNNLGAYIDSLAVLKKDKTPKDKDLETVCDYRKKNLLDTIENVVTAEWQGCADNKISKEKFQLVISFNYADWFLCSTGEKWTSCLNLDGNSANYWYGLPGLMGDKNRVMIYLTRGEKKTAYGIEADKYLFRTWALLDSDDKLNIVRWFPREDIGTFGLYNLIEEKTGIKINKKYCILNENDNFHSKYEIKLIYTVQDFSLFPYLDYAKFTNHDETYLISGESGMFHKKRGYRYVSSDEMCSYDDFSSLSELIDNNTDICSAINDSVICKHCGYNIGEDGEYYNPEGELICINCFDENYFVCRDCGETHSIREEVYIEDNQSVCETCYHENYFHCELSNRDYPLEDSVVATDDRNGRTTFIAYYGIVEENGYIFNEADDIYYKEEYMICDKNGDYIHVDEYENQQELEFEEAV